VSWKGLGGPMKTPAGINNLIRGLRLDEISKVKPPKVILI